MPGGNSKTEGWWEEMVPAMSSPGLSGAEEGRGRVNWPFGQEKGRKMEKAEGGSIFQSLGFRPAAATLMRTSPGPGVLWGVKLGYPLSR